MAWWKKALGIGGAAAKGYTETAKEGLAPHLGNVAGSLIKKKRRNTLTGLGESSAGDDPGGEANSSSSYSPHWEDDRHEDY